MIKVVELVPTLNMGGAESMIKDYCLLFDKEKIEVKVVVMAERLHTAIEQELDKAGVDVTYLGESVYEGDRPLNPFQKAVRFIGRYINFRRTVTSFKPEVIHCHLHIGAYFKFVPLRRLGCRLILTVHNVTSRYFDKSLHNVKKNLEYREVNRLVHKHDMMLIALHDDMKAELKEFFDTDNVVTVTNGIEAKRFDPSLYDRDRIRSELGIGKNTFVIGNVGRLHEQKNHDLIVGVFRIIAARFPDSKLILVGTGELEQKIRKKIREYSIDDKVIMLSNRDDIPELMAAMDVFFFPSRWEGFGNVLIEAQFMGLPCVISDVVPNGAVISEGVQICSLGSPITTWKNIVIAEKGKRYELNKGMAEEYDIINSVRKLEKIYSESA